MEAPRLGSTLLGIALAAIALAPDLGRSTVIRLASGDAHASYEVLASATAGDLVERVAALAADTFAVPLPPQIVLRLYPTPLAFAHGLVHEVGVPPRLAFEMAGTVAGIALPGTVFLLDDGSDADRVRLVAHEVMHLVQYELAGPAARPARWLMEGTAEWAALALLDRLGVDGIERRREASRTAARAYLVASPDFTPGIARRPSAFNRWQRRVGSRLAYQVAYALAEHLVARHGLASVVAYFKAFRDDGDAARNFARAFGTSPARFAAGARAALAGTSVAPPS